MTRFVLTPYLILITLFFLAVPACNPQVQLYKNNGKYYSIFGFLNASADTQFIRIEELRDSMPRSSPPHLNIMVKLTDLTDHTSSTMHDSLFHLIEGNVHNYFTTQKIIPSHEYRLTMAGPGGIRSSAQILMPPTFPEPTITEAIDPGSTLGCIYNSGYFAKIRITGISRLVAVNAIYRTIYISDTGSKEYRLWNIEHLADTTHLGPGVIVGNIDYPGDLCTTDVAHEQRSHVSSVDVVIAAGNPAWPDFLNLDTETETIPGLFSNVKGGTGVLGGVITDTVHLYTNPHKEYQ